MTEKDKRLVAQAKNKRWEDIDEDAAETTEGREALHKVAYDKYLREERHSFGFC